MENASRFAFKIRNQIFFLGIIAPICMLFSACAMQKAYSGPELSPDKIAIIQPDTTKAFTEIEIVSIDDHKLNFFEYKAAVWPGIHKMLINVKLAFPYSNHALGFSQNISFNAEAGRIYTIQAKIDPVNNEGFLWVTADNEPQQFVGGLELGPIKLLTSEQ